MAQRDPRLEERAEANLEDTAQLVEWLRDLSTPVATSALDALFFQKSHAAVAAERERVLGRFALRGELEEMTVKRHRLYAAEVIQQVIYAARAALPAEEPADD